MQSLTQVIHDAAAKNVAIGHFNIADLAGLNGIVAAARAVGVPVIIGTSEGERAFIGPHEAVALIRSLRETLDYPIYLNADHTYSLDGVKEAVDVGYDAVIFDGAKLPLEENIAQTKEVVEYAKSKNPDIIVEGELGYIGTSSRLLESIPEGASITGDLMTKPEDAARFVKETGVDLLAPAVGNLHGMLKNAPNPRLDIGRVADIRAAAGVPLVLHGGSGIADEDFTAAIQAGMAIVHINTEIRVAWRQGLEEALKEKADEIAPYKILPGAVEAVQKVVEKRLKLFSGR